ncbi:MAG: ATP synthase subunit I [Thiolinea sp.]
MRNLLIIQFLIVLAGAIVSWLYQGDEALLPALYGGAVALANTMLLSGRIKKADEIAKTSPQQSVNSLYLGVVQRFVFVLVALGVGLGVLKFLPMPLLGTFMVAQLAYVLAGTRQMT